MHQSTRSGEVHVNPDAEIVLAARRHPPGHRPHGGPAHPRDDEPFAGLPPLGGSRGQGWGTRKRRGGRPRVSGRPSPLTARAAMGAGIVIFSNKLIKVQSSGWRCPRGKVGLYFSRPCRRKESDRRPDPRPRPWPSHFFRRAAAGISRLTMALDHATELQKLAFPVGLVRDVRGRGGRLHQREDDGDGTHGDRAAPLDRHVGRCAVPGRISSRWREPRSSSTPQFISTVADKD